MGHFIKFVLCAVCFFSSAFANAPLTLFSIDTSQRGSEIVNIVKVLTAPPFNSATSELAIQTTTNFIYAPYVVNALIPYVRSITPGPNNTLFIVNYFPKNAPSLQAVVVPVEQIVEVVYSTQTIPTTGFTSTWGTGVLPLITVDPVLRAQDIFFVVSTLLTSPTYQTGVSKVTIVTTTNGPYYPAIPNGIITNVISVSLLANNSSYLQIKIITSQGAVNGTYIIPAEQIQQIVFYPRGY
ncbi:MAG TPA: hypothetical protein VLE89_08750 [Chlamydiales bacterium]|nr:hypothetical protein [Chlamydiales bacterium]